MGGWHFWPGSWPQAARAFATLEDPDYPLRARGRQEHQRRHRRERRCSGSTASRLGPAHRMCNPAKPRRGRSAACAPACRLRPTFSPSPAVGACASPVAVTHRAHRRMRPRGKHPLRAAPGLADARAVGECLRTAPQRRAAPPPGRRGGPMIGAPDPFSEPSHPTDQTEPLATQAVSAPGLPAAPASAARRRATGSIGGVEIELHPVARRVGKKNNCLWPVCGTTARR